MPKPSSAAAASKKATTSWRPRRPAPGKHRVEINWLKPTGKTYRNEFGEELPRLEEGLPEKYHKASTLTADVKPGKNIIDFRLEK